MKKNILLLLSFLILFSYKNVFATMTIQQIQDKYPAGNAYTETYKYTYSYREGNTIRNSNLVAKNCAGFAQTVFRNYYGYTAYFFADQSTDINSVSSGDIVWYNSTSSNVEGHKVFVLSRNGNNVVIADANGEGDQKIRWYYTTNISTLNNNFKLIYKAPYAVGSSKSCIVPNVTGATASLSNTTNGKNNIVLLTWNQLEKVSGYRIIIKNSSGSTVHSYDLTSNDNSYSVTLDAAGNLTAYVYAMREELVSCTPSTANFSIIPISSIDLKADTSEIYMGDKANITATINPANSTYNQTITWSSSDTSIATVYNGVVTGKAEGTVTITATTKTGVTKSIPIKVKYKKAVSFISFDKSTVEVAVGKTSRVVATVYPSDATFQNITWESSNPSIATVDANGVIRGIKRGNTTITATADGVSRTISVVVISSSIERIYFNPSILRIKKGETVTLPSVQAYPANTGASLSGVTYSLYKNGSYAKLSGNQFTGNYFNVVIVQAKYDDLVAYLTVYIDYPSDLNLMENAYQYNDLVGTTVRYDNVDIMASSLNSNVLSISNASSGSQRILRFSPNKGGFSTIRTRNDTDNSFDESLAYVSVPIDVNGTLMYAGDWNNDHQFTMDDLDYFDVYRENVDMADVNGDGVVTDYDKELMDTIIRNHIFQIVEYHELEVFELEETEVTVNVGDSLNLHLNISDGVPYTWSSDSPEYFTVDQNGKVTGIRSTSGYVRVKARDKEVKCRVTVQDLRIQSINITPYSLSFNKIGNSSPLSVTYNPENTTSDKTITWESKDPSVATVDSNGLVTAKGYGSTEIVATSSNGKTATRTVNVYHYPITKILFYSSSRNVVLGGTNKNNYYYYPTNTNDDTTLTYIVEDPSIVSVDSDGTLHGLKEGTTTVTGTAVSGVSDSFTVTVSLGAIQSVSLNHENVFLQKGKSFSLEATVLPEKTSTSRTLTWVSSDKNVVTVNSNGVLTAVKNGKATITVSTANGKYATCEVTVGDVMRGDFTKDGDVTFTDVILGLRKVFGYVEKTSEDVSIGDLNSNGDLDFTDIIILLRYVFGYIESI